MISYAPNARRPVKAFRWRPCPPLPHITRRFGGHPPAVSRSRLRTFQAKLRKIEESEAHKATSCFAGAPCDQGARDPKWKGLLWPQLPLPVGPVVALFAKSWTTLSDSCQAGKVQIVRFWNVHKSLACIGSITAIDGSNNRLPTFPLLLRSLRINAWRLYDLMLTTQN